MELSYDYLDSQLVTPVSESEAIKLIKAMSERLTSDRENLEGYSIETKNVSAYSLFYLPTNFPKLDFLFDQLPPDFLNDLSKTHFIDFGAGPGTYTLAFLKLFNNPDRIWVVDKSDHMLKQAQKFISSNFKSYKNINFLSEVKATSGSSKTLFFGNSLNEIKFNEAKNVIEKLSPENVMLIEPGTKESFLEILKLRNYLVEQGYNILYPCSSNNACPIANDKSEWCHQVLRMTHDQSIERLSQLVGLDRKVMPFSSLVCSKKEYAHNKEGLFYQFLNETKFSFVWKVCLASDENKLVTMEIMKKDLSKKEQKVLKKVSVGLKFNYTVTKEVQENFFRVKVDL